jgi:hypothetical protein
MHRVALETGKRRLRRWIADQLSFSAATNHGPGLVLLDNSSRSWPDLHFDAPHDPPG